MKILVSNPAHIGDVILTTSVLPVLREAYPKAQIDMIVGSWSAPIVENHTLLDRVHYFDHPAENRFKSRKAKKRIGGKSWKRALEALKAEKYNVVFEMYSLYKENLGKLFLHAEIPERVGFWFSPTKQFFNHQIFWCDLWGHSGHMVEINGALLKGFGIENLELLRPTLKYKDKIQGPSLPEEYIAIHVGAGEKKKEWNQEAWKELTLKLESLKLPLVFLGRGSREKALIETCTRGIKRVINLCDHLSLRELFPVLEKASLVIGLDSMAGHLTAALGGKGVFIYGGTAQIARWRPFSPHCHVISPHPTLFEGEYAPKEAIHTISSELVFQKVKELLSCQKEKELAIL